MFDGSFFRDQQASLDFYYVAIGRVAHLAKADDRGLLRASGAAFLFRWLLHRRPRGDDHVAALSDYFDGIVSGDPAMRTGHSNLALGFMTAVDSLQTLIPRRFFSDSDRKLIVNSLLTGLRRQRWAQGRHDLQLTRLPVRSLGPGVLGFQGRWLLEQSAGGFAEQGLCRSEVSTRRCDLSRISFRRRHRGHGRDSRTVERATSSQSPRARISRTSTPITKRRAWIADTTARLGDSTWTNLTTFAGHGGKLLFYHGLSDPWFSPLETLRYYEKMSKDTSNGAATSWSRLYLVPGMGHCQGGSATLDRFDMLSAVVDWVEKSVAPDRVVATGTAFPGRSRPLCPYPQHAEYTGHGDTNDAANFVCQE